MSTRSALTWSTTPLPRRTSRSTPSWRRKAIRRSDSPWGQQPSGRGLSASRGGGRRGGPDRSDGWLIGPTWLYVLAAIAIFAAAAAVAVVQATGSDESEESQAAQTTGAEPSAPTQAQQTAVATEPDNAAEDAQTTEPTRQPLAQQQSDEQEVSPSHSDGQTEQAEAETQAEQEQADTEADAPEQGQDHPLRGFIRPIAGACVTEFPGHLPGSPRTYRNHGVHEGLDFYEWASCTSVTYTTEILAAKAGVIIRADLDYVEITPADWQRFIDANWEGEAILDELRGRQVWIDHGRGIVTRYAHLSEIAVGIAVGVEVQQGQLIGHPGESGQQEVYANPGTDIHLHFEIRVGDGWLGQGESPADARTLYLQAFGLAE
ncbi:MAG: peptidoglycan DD-metalloendopeptidase family protein [Chloroflexi bacterium]|nr:peptidoglycan DD-metalloendopeptidase family protein [Chloroflexota bacterium]